MKIKITKNQVEQIISIFSKFLNKDLKEGVCNVMVDYDEIMDRFVLNIFFDRKYIVKLDDGGKQSSFLRKTVNEYGNLFRDFSSQNPVIYEHFENC